MGLCERCTAAGRTSEATRVDHIKPLDHGGSDEDSNTRNLCVPCHLEVTAEQFATERARGLGGCDHTGMPLDPSHPWYRSAIGG